MVRIREVDDQDRPRHRLLELRPGPPPLEDAVRTSPRASSDHDHPIQATTSTPFVQDLQTLARFRNTGTEFPGSATAEPQLRRLMIICGTGGKPELLAIDMIMIIKDRHQLVAQVAMGAERRRSNVEAAEVRTGIGQTSRQLPECEPPVTDVQCRVQVAPDGIEIAVGEVIVRNLCNKEEVALSKVGRELLDRPAKVPRLLVADMFDGVDPETVAIGQCDPVHVRPGKKTQGFWRKGEVAQVLKVSAAELSVVGIGKFAGVEAASS